MKTDIRWQQRFHSFKKALTKLLEVVENKSLEDLSELEAEGLIQRFEYTYELAWKTLQDLLRYKGYTDIAGPNPVLQQALQDGYINDEDGWRGIKRSRERTSQIYDEATAEEIAKAIFSNYHILFQQLETRLEKEI